MSELGQRIAQWALDNYGVDIKDHQMERVETDFCTLARDLKKNTKELMIDLQQRKIDALTKAVDIITVQESYFFRDQSLFKLLQQYYLPKLISQKLKNNDLKINVLSAGCSKGEELYSIAILLDQLVPSLSSWKLNLLGIDVNSIAVNDAIKASYSSSSLRASKEEVMKSYFIKENDSYKLKDSIRHLAEFEVGNLYKVKKFNMQYDIILCRNVFIYLSRQAIELCLQNFNQCLKDEGVLFLGSSDFVTYCVNPLNFHMQYGVSYFTKHKEAMVEMPEEIKELKGAAYITKQTSQADALKNIQQLLLMHKYQEALSASDKFITIYGEKGLVYQYKVEALIALGDIETAKELLQRAIDLDPLNPVAFFLKGLAEMDAKELTLAQNYFDKALILKPNFPEAVFYLALCLLRNNEIEKGIRLANEALKLAKATDQDQCVLGTREKMSAFVKAIESYIQSYKERHYGR